MDELSVYGYIRRIQKLLNNMIIPNTIYQICTSYIYWYDRLIVYRPSYGADIQICSINSIINREKTKMITLDNVLSLNIHKNQWVDHGWCGNAYIVSNPTKCVPFIVSDIILPFDILKENTSPICDCGQKLDIITVTNSSNYTYIRKRRRSYIYTDDDGNVIHVEIPIEYDYECNFCTKKIYNKEEIYSCKHNGDGHKYIYCACKLCATSPLVLARNKYNENKSKSMKCVCGTELILIEAEDCYEKSNGIACDNCNVAVIGKNKVYHCKNNKCNDIHKDGYDLCVLCANNNNNDNNKRYTVLFEFGGKRRKNHTDCKAYIINKDQKDLNVYLWELPEPESNYRNFYGVVYSKYYGLVYIKEDKIHTLSLKDGINAKWNGEWNKLSYKRPNDDENYHCCVINDDFDNELLFIVDGKTKKVEIFDFLKNESKPLKSMNYKIESFQNCIYYDRFRNAVYVIGELTKDGYQERDQERRRQQKEFDENGYRVLHEEQMRNTTYIVQCYIVSQNKWINLPDIELDSYRYEYMRERTEFKSYKSLCIWMEYNVLFVTSFDWQFVKYLNVDSDKEWKKLIDKEKNVINFKDIFEKDSNDSWYENWPDLLCTY